MKNCWADETLEKRGIIACTDGVTVWYGKSYDGLPMPERNYIFVHELMHGIMMHPQRYMMLMLVRGFVNAAIANYAADAIINEAIERNTALPSGVFMRPVKFPPVMMTTIHEAMAEAIKITGATPPSNYDPKAVNGLQMEQIYDWLMWALDKVKEKRREEESKGSGKPGKNGSEDSEENASGNDSNSGEGDQESEGSDTGKGQGKKSKSKSEKGQGTGAGAGNMPAETKIEKMAGEEAWDIEESIEKFREMLGEGVTTTDMIKKINRDIEENRMKIEKIIQGLKLQGVGQGNMLIELSGDLPKAVIPWNHIIRKEVTRGIGTKLTDSYTRYGSSTKYALARGSKQIPYSPGTTIYSERPRVLVIMDVSGSHVGCLPICFAEVLAITRMKGAVVDVMTFDDGVQEIFEIKNLADLKKIMHKGIRGNGGTCLRDVWEKVEKMRDPYRLAIIMTDGYLSEGKPPKIPVVWAITPGGSNNFSYGKIVEIPHVAAD
jgi:predicted metal-dependent peptidase